MDGTSLTPEQEKLNALRQVLPEVFSEGKIDWEKLKATLGEDINFANERYVLNWAGKSDAFKVLQAPTTKTLVPAKDESVNFNETENIFIEGENLEVLKVLQKSYFGKVKMIYIDPPYNTGKDSFIYPDKFSETKAEYKKRVGDKDEEGYMTKDGMFKKNSKENGQYHSNWLNMMMPRLYLAKNLLKQDGVIFVSIDDNEVHNLRLLMNEIFGEENFIDCLKWKRKKQPSFLAKHTAKVMEYVLVYAKQAISLEKLSIEGTSDSTKKVINISNNESTRYFKSGVRIKKEGDGVIPKGRYTIRTMDVEYDRDVHYKDGKTTNDVIVTARFSTSQTNIDEYIDNDLLFITSNLGLRRDVGKDEIGKRKSITDLLLKDWGDNQESDNELREIFGTTDYFDYTKPLSLLKNLIKSNFTEDEIILDFFAGSGTTAHAVMALNAEDGGNRKCISVQLPEECHEKSEAYKAGYKNIADIAKERIRRAGKKIEEDLGKQIDELQDEIKKLESEIPTEETKVEIESLKTKIEELKNQDLGFKVLKLADSNFKQWQQITGKDKQALEEQMKLFVDPVAKNATTENMVYELLLKSGKDLNSTIEAKDGFYAINETELILVLEKANQEIIDAVIASKPQKVIALDKLFKGNDQLKTNASLQMKDAGIEFKTI